ncbi:hypothetical protein E1265_36000 [Streptomyces sp. 8K308]|uniref:hypothetical protein n=1 Tax=Streptomyces sp. 8K308 TaxID=2530388 RepID=UPI0010465028|nr:hypothetical protein [Streptomyces sp. 8K308]TDC04388.1 hypothetical protein E1265_36000 [Streptomyces sp. 8K308]
MDTTTGERILNPAAARRAARYAGESERLGGMRRAHAAVAAATGLFGDLPAGARAEAAVVASAEGLRHELAGAGATVEDIRHSATEVAAIADRTDHAAHEALADARRTAEALWGEREGGAR